MQKNYAMKQLLYLLFILFVLSSCGSYKQAPYFQDLRGDSIAVEEIKNYSALKIQKNDQLAVNISSLEPKAAAIYNLGNRGTEGSSGASNIPVSYLVDASGNIQIPSYGPIHVEGLTTAQARNLITEKLAPFLGKPVVMIRLVDFKFSVLGDVAAPGVYKAEGERVSLVEAISMAGDLTVTAKSNNVLLVRESQGKRERITLNLNDKDIFNSQYFYLQPNDVLYVQPSKAKYAVTDNTTKNLSLALSAISVLVVIFTQLK